MVLPAQFELGLELTNIVNPLGAALSKLGSLALVDAIKRSGSDVITEMKLASLLGRHRIDPVMEFSFREVVAKSEQSVISRYIDIVLDSGAGPTVQEALKDPALFSMVIQLSALSFGHTDVSLANATTTAIENILRRAGAGVESAPDYVSLLGTIRACQQQTASFRWSSLYDAVNHKVHRTLLSSQEDQQRNRRSSKRRRVDCTWRTATKSIATRCLPFPVFQSLLMWLQSLQSLPEHRLLHIRCDTGISTVVVWCHHLLGLNVTVRLNGVDTCFGEGMSNVFVEESTSQQSGASLMDAVDQNEPLFSLSKIEEDPPLDFESRAEAFGYGMNVLKQATDSEDTDSEDELRNWSHLIIGHCLSLFRSSKTNVHINVSRSPSLRRDLTEQRILQAGRFLFALDNLDQDLVESGTEMLLIRTEHTRKNPFDQANWASLVDVLVTFARISDLNKCANLPLSTEVSYRFKQRRSMGIPSRIPDMLTCFDLLSRLLLGHCYTNDYIKPAFIVSAWGWSIFLDPVDAVDPVDVSTDIMRVMPGVPSRRGLRKARIIDGPTDLKLSSIAGKLLDPRLRITFFPGVSTAKRGPVLIGHHGPDAFSATQIFNWRSHDRTDKSCKLGFRQMLEFRLKFDVVQSCHCEDVVAEDNRWIDDLRIRAFVPPNNTTNELYGLWSDYSMPTLQTPEFEEVVIGDVEQHYGTRLYCHITKWPLSGRPSDPSIERVLMKPIVLVKGGPFPGRSYISRLEDDNSIPLNPSGCCWYFYVTESAAARWLQLTDLCSANSDKNFSYILRGNDCCFACAGKIVSESAAAVCAGKKVTIDPIMVIL